jgi:hypothetical protein
MNMLKIFVKVSFVSLFLVLLLLTSIVRLSVQDGRDEHTNTIEILEKMDNTTRATNGAGMCVLADQLTSARCFY